MGDTSAIDRVVLRARVPIAALEAEDEVVGDISVDTNCSAPADLRLVVAFRMETGDANLAFGPEAAEALSLSRCSAPTPSTSASAEITPVCNRLMIVTPFY